MVMRYLNRLTTGDYYMRDEAFEALIALGGRAVLPLIDALDDDRGDVRQLAALALGRIGDVRATPPLMLALRTGDAKGRAGAAFALGEMGDPGAVPLLIAALKDESDPIRSAAISALGKLRPIEAVVPLIATWSGANQNSDIQFRVVEAIAALGEPAFEPLLAALQNPCAAIRVGAVMTLNRLGDRRSVAPLIDKLRVRNEDSAVQRQLVCALGEIGDSSAVMPLIETLQDCGRPWEVRCFAAISLGKLQDTRAVPALMCSLEESDNEVRSYAARSLGQLGDVQAVPSLIALLAQSRTNGYNRTDSSKAASEKGWRYVGTCCQAVEALGMIGDARAIDPLVSLFNDKSCPRELCNRVCLALGRLQKQGYTLPVPLSRDVTEATFPDSDAGRETLRHDGHSRDEHSDRGWQVDTRFDSSVHAATHQSRPGISTGRSTEARSGRWQDRWRDLWHANGH